MAAPDPRPAARRVRWRIRTKLLVLLLAITLLPLAFHTLINYRTIRELGGDLASKAHIDLSQQARAQLALIADNYALLIQRQREILELLVQQQAREVEVRLASPPPPLTGPTFFASDIDHHDARLNVMPSQTHLRSGDADTGVSVPISYDTQAFRLPAGAERAEFDEVLRQLGSLSAAYRNLHERHPELIFWQYTTLESGLHSVYPAHGGYPADYEPRSRPWYRQQSGTMKLLWHAPLVDASTRQVIVTVSMPVFGADEQLAGVTAIDVSLTAYLAGLPQLSGWAEDSSVFLVTLDAAQGPGRRVRVLARQTYAAERSKWQTEFGPAWLSPTDAKQRQQLFTDLQEGRPGVMKARHESLDAFWAYQPIGDSGTWLIIILPYQRAVAMASMARDEALARTGVQLQATLALGVPLLLAAVVAALWSARAISRPVQQLVDATHRVTAGDFEARTNITSGDELEMLGTAFNTMVPHLKERFRHAEGMRLAREVQQNLIPATPAERRHLDLAGVSIFAEETGGDYYDFLELGPAPDGALGIAIGDVSGHGISSALLMTTARALLHAFAPQSRTLSETMCAINERLADDVHAGRFMTLYYLVVAPVSRTLRWVSAGHDAALLYRPGDDAFHELAGQDIPLGVDDHWLYRECAPFSCRAGDVVLMVTDGVWDTHNAEDEAFGKERLKELLRAHAGKTAAEICNLITGALHEYRGAIPQSDDLTVVVIRVL